MLHAYFLRLQEELTEKANNNNNSNNNLQLLPFWLPLVGLSCPKPKSTKGVGQQQQRQQEQPMGGGNKGATGNRVHAS